jgi:hypothetical protein
MFIGCAVETLRDEVLLDAASTPPVKAVLAAGYCYDVGEFNGACYVPRDSDCGEPHPFAING